MGLDAKRRTGSFIIKRTGSIGRRDRLRVCVGLKILLKYPGERYGAGVIEGKELG